MRIKPSEIRNSFHLPIETAILVPSTTAASQKVTRAEFSKRIEETRSFLSKLFGGYTSIQGIGGYMSDSKGLIKEQVMMVVSYAQEKDWKKNKNKFLAFAREKGREFDQESIGVIVENDLYYLDTYSNKKKKIGKIK